MKHGPFYHQSGLTLIETMVALVILSVGLVPVLAVISSSNNLSALIRNNLIAADLAQEGVEIIRGIRDSNWFADAPFDRYLRGCGSPTCDWRVEWNSTVPLPLGSNPTLKFDSATGIYSYGAGVDTGFMRKISISRVPHPCECDLKVKSQVTWIWKGINRSVTVESHLFDWK